MSADFRLWPMLIEELDRLGEEFRPDELAYLALTSKAEGPLRDRLAFALHRRLWPTWVVAREHPARTDLSVLAPDDGRPLALLEAKAFYTFDAANDEKCASYIDTIAADVAKAHAQALAKTDVFALALVTHPLAVGKLPTGVMKYERGIAGAIRDHGTANAVRQIARRRLCEGLAKLGPLSVGSLAAGEALGVEVEVLHFLIGPVAARI
jgi:hypothetical protein